MMVGFGPVWILVLATILFGVFAVVRNSGDAGFELASSPGDSAEEILRQRYARGDIDRDEFEERLHELQR